MYCKKCGAQLSDNAVLCEKCGTLLLEQEEVSPVPKAVAPESKVVTPEPEVVDIVSDSRYDVVITDEILDKFVSSGPVRERRPANNSQPRPIRSGRTNTPIDNAPMDATSPIEATRPMSTERPVGAERPIRTTRPAGAERPIRATRPLDEGRPIGFERPARASRQTNTERTAAPARTRSKKNGGKGIAVAFWAIPLVIIVGIIAISSLFNQVKIEKFINEDAVFDGADGYGTISEDFIDYEAMAKELYGKNYDGETYDGDNFQNFIAYSIDKDSEEGLSNGDIVKVTFKVNYKSINDLERVKKRLVGEDEFVIEYKVIGLSDVKKVNIYEAIEMVENVGTKDAPEIVVRVKDEVETKNYTITTVTTNKKIEFKIEFKIEDGTTRSGSVFIYTDRVEYDKETEKAVVEISSDADAYIEYGFILDSVSKEYKVLFVEKEEEDNGIPKSEKDILTNVFEVIRGVKNVGTKAEPVFEVEFENDGKVNTDDYAIMAKYNNNTISITVSYIGGVDTFDVPVTISLNKDNYNSETGKIKLSIKEDLSKYIEKGYLFTPVSVERDVA